jgi:chromosome segregation protein
VLKRITIQGFKSFAKKGDIVFASPIVAIVGPNGSGKSNVAEAFRFVLGEQSMKAMRGSKGEDLIWNGSSAVPRANKGSVEVIFDNTKRLFPYDYDEVRIERAVYRDGLNEYSINGSKVRLKDIHELLAKVHVGSSGHHIISQGQADKILNASPVDRREMLEDALGLTAIELKRVESIRKLTKTKENKTQVDMLRREAAPRLRFLEKQLEKKQNSLKPN